MAQKCYNLPYHQCTLTAININITNSCKYVCNFHIVNSISKLFFSQITTLRHTIKLYFNYTNSTVVADGINTCGIGSERLAAVHCPYFNVNTWTSLNRTLSLLSPKPNEAERKIQIPKDSMAHTENQ